MAPQRRFLMGTKLQMPHIGPRRVERPRLHHLLDACPGGGVLLLCAPAGFGKTTLLRTWAEDLQRDFDEHPVSWLTLDARDNQPHRFIRYLSAACSALVPVGEDNFTGDDLLSGGDLEVSLEAILERLEQAKAPFLLVLDDLHVLENQEVFKALSFLLEHWPIYGRIALLSRREPPLPLAVWRARQRLASLHATELRLTEEESLSLLSRYTDLPPEQRMRVARTVGGWPAGLQLAMMSLQSGSAEQLLERSDGTHSDIEAYLSSEIFHQQTATLQSFLLCTSILERFCASLCDAVLGSKKSQEHLDALTKHHLFLRPLAPSSGPNWYSYEPLFAAFLQKRLKQELDEPSIRKLHDAASLWYAEQLDVEAALHHAFAMGSFDLAASLILRFGPRLSFYLDLPSILSWISQLPPTLANRHPSFRLAKSLILSFRDEWDEAAEAELIHTEELLQAGPEGMYPGLLESGETKRQHLHLQGQVALIRAVNKRNDEDLSPAITYAQEAVSKLLPEIPVFWSFALFHLGSLLWRTYGDVPMALKGLEQQARSQPEEAPGPFRRVIHTVGQAEVFLIGGKLHQAARLCRGALESYDKGKSSRFLVPIRILYVHILMHWNQLEEAQKQIAAASVFLERLSWREREQLLVQKALCELAKGDTAEAATVLQEARKQQPAQHRNPSSYLDCFQAIYWLQIEDRDAANYWATQSGLSHVDPVGFRIERPHLTYARVLLAQEKPAEALTLLGNVERDAEAGERRLRALEAKTLRALAYTQQGEHQQAQRILLDALGEAEAQDHIRLFVNEGAPLKDLLLGILKATYRGSLTAPIPYIQKLLQAFPRTDEHKGDSFATAMYNLDPLSTREHEILLLAATGQTYKNIATQLSISPATVKRHMNNIFGKLGVHSRDEAVGAAKKMQLL